MLSMIRKPIIQASPFAKLPLDMRFVGDSITLQNCYKYVAKYEIILSDQRACHYHD